MNSHVRHAESRSKSLKFKFNKPSLKRQLQTLPELETIHLNIIAQSRTQTQKPRYQKPKKIKLRPISIGQWNNLDCWTIRDY
ncbi:hypothetical protein pb186bvf_020822 [Paramecium bursaria]